jgi:TM2 domain-containing membrane protein YozV
MSADQGSSGTPEEQAVTPPLEGEMLEVFAQDLTPAPPAPPAEPPPAAPAPISAPSLPPADPLGHHDDLEVTLVSEPPAAAPSGWPAPPAPVAPAQPVAPAEVVLEPPAPAPVVVQPLTPVVLQPAAPVGVGPTPTPASPVAVGGESQWYTTSAGKTYGPYSSAELRNWLQTGQVTWDTQAARAGETTWQPLHQIVEFNPSPGYGPPVGGALTAGKKDKTIAGILGILLGAFGAHHWYLGNYLYAAIYLAVTVLSVGFLGGLVAIAGIVEGIMYLTSNDEKFQAKYNHLFLSG